MSMAYGRALMARDVASERKKMLDWQEKVNKKQEEAQRAMSKRGLWGSIGSKLASYAIGAALTPILGPGGVMVGKALGGAAGGYLSQALSGTGKDIKGYRKIAESGPGKGNFMSSQRAEMKNLGKTLSSDMSKALSGMDKGVWQNAALSAAVDYGMDKGVPGIKDQVKGLGSKDTWMTPVAETNLKDELSKLALSDVDGENLKEWEALREAGPQHGSYWDRFIDQVDFRNGG